MRTGPLRVTEIAERGLMLRTVITGKFRCCQTRGRIGLILACRQNMSAEIIGETLNVMQGG